jgi:hypothetical protein
LQKNLRMTGKPDAQSSESAAVRLGPILTVAGVALIAWNAAIVLGRISLLATSEFSIAVLL